jgi:hypothetical protein
MPLAAALISLELSIEMPRPVTLIVPESEIWPVIVLLLMMEMPVGPGEIVPVLPRVPVKDELSTTMQAWCRYWCGRRRRDRYSRRQKQPGCRRRSTAPQPTTSPATGASESFCVGGRESLLTSLC